MNDLHDIHEEDWEMGRKELWEISDYFFGSVTVGARGQVVIPAKVRKEMGIKAGDKLLVFIHPAKMGALFMPLEHVDAILQELRELVSTHRAPKRKRRK